MTKLDGKVALVTGSSKGIGAAIARKLALDGASVAVNYVSGKRGAEAVVAAIGELGGKAAALPGDVSRAAEARDLVEETVRRFGRLDVLVNNSGVYEFATLEEITETHYRRLFDVNVLGVLLTSQAAAKHLGEGASIVNVSSVVARIPTPSAAVYTGTKAAVNALTSVLARELAPRRIRVNAVSPGYVVTEGTRTAGITGSSMETDVVAQTPLGRAGTPEDIAEVVAFLASDAAGWITGEIVTASGGIG